MDPSQQLYMDEKFKIMDEKVNIKIAVALKRAVKMLVEQFNDYAKKHIESLLGEVLLSEDYAQVLRELIATSIQ